MKYIIEPNNSTLHASFSKDYQPVLRIFSGDTVQYKTIDIAWGYSPKEGERVRYQSREKEGFWGHPVIGPIHIEGAKPGMVLEININDIVPASYGWNCSGGSASWQNVQLGLADHEEVTFDWQLDNEKSVGICHYNDQTFSVPLRPFMGVMAVAPSEEGVHSTMPPRYCGGNIDCKELIKGSTLYLPVAVEGALFSVGDGHAAQGDGEVSGQAIECPMELVDLTFHLREDISLGKPFAKTPSGWISFGFDEDLNKAAIMALEGMLDFIQKQYNFDKAEANALASVSVDLRITQIVNDVKGVHAILPFNAITKMR